MIDKSDLIQIADLYKQAAAVESDSTVSYRVFGDTKKLAALRGDADITIGRFNAAIIWFAANWPEGAACPEVLQRYQITDYSHSETQGDAA